MVPGTNRTVNADLPGTSTRRTDGRRNRGRKTACASAIHVSRPIAKPLKSWVMTAMAAFLFTNRSSDASPGLMETPSRIR